MSYRRFQDWLLNEKSDIFGFEKEFKNQQMGRAGDDDKAINFVDIEQITGRLSEYTLGDLQGNNAYVNEVVWGDHTGAVRCRIHNTLRVEVERLGHNFLGEEVWATKRLYQINRDGVGSYEDKVIQEVFDSAQSVVAAELDSPQRELKMEPLVAHVANRMRNASQDMFYFANIMEMDKNDYIIRFFVRGHGVEAPDQQRVIENQTRMTFDNKKGTLRAMNYNVESKISGHKWRIMPSDTDMYFFPTQSREEIGEIMGTIMHWY